VEAKKERESKGKQQQGAKGVKDRVGPQQEKVKRSGKFYTNNLDHDCVSFPYRTRPGIMSKRICQFQCFRSATLYANPVFLPNADPIPDPNLI
jgi:hypothetical protein